MILFKKIERFYKDTKIEYQRWRFRTKFKSGEKVDLENQLRVIEKANKLSVKRKCRLWVIRIMPGKFRICTKGDLKAILRSCGIAHPINMYQLGNEIVHITKKLNELR